MAPESTPERMREVLKKFASAAVTPVEYGVEADKGRDDKDAAQNSTHETEGTQSEEFPKTRR